MRIILVLTALLCAGGVFADDSVEGRSLGLPFKIKALVHRVEVLERQNRSLSRRVQALDRQIQSLQAQAHERYTDAEAQDAADPFDVLGVFSRSDNSIEIIITGADLVIDAGNLHVRNGMGTTDSTNSVGNVIIGYNESSSLPDDRTGSHMLVVGIGHNFRSYGGIVAGQDNTSSG